MRGKWFSIGQIIVLLAISILAAEAQGEAIRELKVHLAQANNTSPYAFVRAKFEPGEVADPWSVRFFDAAGTEVPYFVWDSMTWQVARDGRADWGHRYALLNHAPGNAPDVLDARSKKIAWAKENLPEVGAKLESQDNAAKQFGDTTCAAMYLLRCQVPALGKQRLTMRIYSQRQVEPRLQRWQGSEVKERFSVAQGDLSFQGLPDRLSVNWKGREVYRSAGFDAGGTAGTASHADASRPYSIETSTGIITKLTITGQTPWRQDGMMDWQCTYWLFPDGGQVALEGFCLGQASKYLGGPQKLSILAAPEGVPAITEARTPDWDRPWWLHQTGDRGFVATHLFSATPLAIGYGNNPFTVNAEGPSKDPQVVADGARIALRWHHEVNDPAILRLVERQSVGVVNGHMAVVKDPASGPGELGCWQPKVDWLYRQYVLGIGDRAEAAESSLRGVLGAAAGWIDRPVSQEEVATLLVSMIPEIGKYGQSAEIGLLRVLPAVFNGDQRAIQAVLRDRLQDFPARTDFYIDLMRRNVAEGGKPADGGKTLPDGSRREGWTGNPCYHAALMPCSVRTLEFFEVPFRQDEYRQAILRYADFGLELLGGNPVDFDRFRIVLEGEWPSRTVPTIPIMLHAYTLRSDERYARAAKLLFDDLLKLVERNPHGYFPAWTFTPKADKYDTVYNPVSYERGITAFWSDEQLKLIGRERASQFVAAQARWLVFSGQFQDTLETDNATAIRACNHGGHTGLRNQIGIYLYDDFDFYRGLLGDLVAWSAVSRQENRRTPNAGTGPYRTLELSNAGSSMVRWALDIGPDARWLESKVQRTDHPGDFRFKAWNRMPKAQPTLKVAPSEVGLAGAEDVLQVQLLGPAFREPTEVDVRRIGGTLRLKVNRPVKLQVNLHALLSDRPQDARLSLQMKRSDGSWQPVSDGVTWESGRVAFPAVAGEFELRQAER